MDYLLQLDTDILLKINGWHSEFFDTFMRIFTSKYIWIVMYVTIAAVIWRLYGWQRALIAVIAVGMAVGASDFVCASCIRPLAERMRPTNPDNYISQFVHIVDGYRSGKYGFPSCHAANTFALALFTSLIFKNYRYTLFIFCWALLQCYSRIYLGVHYPGDIIVGALVGITISALLYRLLSKYVSFSEPNKRRGISAIFWIGIATVVFIVMKTLQIPDFLFR